MNKKKTTSLIVVIILIAFIIGFIIIIKNSNKGKISKGYEVFGVEYCNGHPISAATGWPSSIRCRICEKNKENTKHNTDAIICPQCSKITGRCDTCGKLLKK